MIARATSDAGIQRYAIVMTMEWKDDKDFMAKYGYSNPEMLAKWVSQFFAYETGGILLRSKVVKADIIYALGGFSAVWSWEKYKDIIQNRRDTAWGQGYMSNAEFFVQEMLKIGLRTDPSFKDRLETFRRTLKP